MSLFRMISGALKSVTKRIAGHNIQTLRYVSVRLALFSNSNYGVSGILIFLSLNYLAVNFAKNFVRQTGQCLLLMIIDNG
jgi:hypothetical protein